MYPMFRHKVVPEYGVPDGQTQSCKLYQYMVYLLVRHKVVPVSGVPDGQTGGLTVSGVPDGLT